MDYANLRRFLGYEKPDETAGPKLDLDYKKPKVEESIFAAPVEATPEPVRAPASLPTPVKPQNDIGVFQRVSKENPLLGAIAMNETSGGKNLHHATDPKSGMTAGGMFGMMPATATDVLHNNPQLVAKYPELAAASKDLKTNHAVFTRFFNSNPEGAAEFAKAHLIHNMKQLGNDQNAALHSWFWGAKNTQRALARNPNEVNNSDYVIKALRYMKKPVVAATEE